MRVAVLADIHSNLAALQAVLEHANDQGAERLWCLGDIVGYAADPGPCVDLMRQHATLCLAGNHDLGAAGRVNIDEFNPTAATALRWTSAHLSDDPKAFLRGLPGMTEGGSTFAHASPHDPVWEYVRSADFALENFKFFTTPLCFAGHSYTPFVCEGPGSDVPLVASPAIPLPQGTPWLSTVSRGSDYVST